METRKMKKEEVICLLDQVLENPDEDLVSLNILVVEYRSKVLDLLAREKAAEAADKVYRSYK